MPEAFAVWAGLSPRQGAAAFGALGGSLIPARTPAGEAWLLSEDEAACRTCAMAEPAAQVRLLPSGDPYLLLQGADRELVVPDVRQRGELWTPRVWPGGLLIDGEVAGTWRRASTVLTVQPWRALSPAERDAVAVEAESLPLPGLDRRVTVRWDE
jgi:hypothetical protein